MTAIASLLGLSEKATAGEWHWVIEDRSTATLGVGMDPGMGDPHVLSVSPCRSCEERGTEWKWGRCLTPSEADAEFIAAACNFIRSPAFAALVADAERLDWLIANMVYVGTTAAKLYAMRDWSGIVFGNHYKTPRAAIDAARTERNA